MHILFLLNSISRDQLGFWELYLSQDKLSQIAYFGSGIKDMFFLQIVQMIILLKKIDPALDSRFHSGSLCVLKGVSRMEEDQQHDVLFIPSEQQFWNILSQLKTFQP